ncbi:MAG: hypothetical protein NTY38_10340 [Acidobacteria bacterium]|nr:hypothetical protein [Acidobacteriota bacterium]
MRTELVFFDIPNQARGVNNLPPVLGPLKHDSVRAATKLAIDQPPDSIYVTPAILALHGCDTLSISMIRALLPDATVLGWV